MKVSNIRSALGKDLYSAVEAEADKSGMNLSDFLSELMREGLDFRKANMNVDTRGFLACAEWKGNDGRDARLLYDPDSAFFFIQTSPERAVRVLIQTAFKWWFERKLLDEKTGSFIEWDEIEHLHGQVADVLTKMETTYRTKIAAERERAAKRFPRKQSGTR